MFIELTEMVLGLKLKDMMMLINQIFRMDLQSHNHILHYVLRIQDHRITNPGHVQVGDIGFVILRCLVSQHLNWIKSYKIISVISLMSENASFQG